MLQFTGADISKKTFDGTFNKKGVLKHEILGNNLKGFKRLLKIIDKESTVAMEASGPYYLPLATFLYTNGIQVVVINPLKIKKFSQMNFNRAKTDKKDAEVIRQYAVKMIEESDLWEPEQEYVMTIKQLHTSIELARRQYRQTYNQLGAFESSGFIDQKLKRSLELRLKSQEKEFKSYEARIEEICKEHYSETLKCLTTIPGIGIKAASVLIAITNDFTKFDHYKQLIAYVGFSPRIYQSGTSIKGRAHICKMGKSQIRKLLYVCSWSAKKYNKGCSDMHKRLSERGKPEKVIKVALANKLLKQAFAIGKSKTEFIENYQPNPCF